MKRKGNNIITEIADNGVGMSEETLKHIFEKEKEIEAECQFCGKKYKFTEKDFDDVLKK